MRDDDTLARTKLDGVVTKLDAEATADAEEELVFAIVPVPDEGPAEFHEFDLLPVQLAHHLGTPVLGDERQLLREIDLLHEIASAP